MVGQVTRIETYAEYVAAMGRYATISQTLPNLRPDKDRWEASLAELDELAGRLFFNEDTMLLRALWEVDHWANTDDDGLTVPAAEVEWVARALADELRRGRPELDPVDTFDDVADFTFYVGIDHEDGA